MARCYTAIDTGIKDYVQKIKDFFLLEGTLSLGGKVTLGLEYRRLHPFEDYSHSVPLEGISTHACGTCNYCLVDFFQNAQMIDIIDVRSILNSRKLREAVVLMYRHALQ